MQRTDPMLKKQCWQWALSHLHFWAFLALMIGSGPGKVQPAWGADAHAEAVARLSADLEYLSADALGGRDVGSEGIAAAGQFIAERFQQLGLATDSFDGGPYQEFTIPGPPELGPAESNWLSFDGVEGLPKLLPGVNFTPVALGSSGAFAGEVVFAGYGISAPDLNYDDYGGLDVAGKVVIVLRKEPNQSDPNSKFEGERPSQHAFFSTKELNAALHRAAALILVNDRATVAAAGRDELPKVAEAGSPVSDNQIPTLYCLRSVADLLLQSSGQSLEQLEAAIDEQLQPQSRILSGIRCQGATEILQSRIPVRNVVGFLPGTGSLAEEYIVVGAHYDHVGMGGAGSLAPGTIEIHNGADDNASGSTVLLEVARVLAGDSSPSRRSIVFVAFTAEERGLLGSKHYVRNPRWPLEQTVTMLNLDMVGRMEGSQLTVFGTGTATEFDALVDRLGADSGLAISKQAAGFGPSDHSSFYEAGIPVFHFFTGLHNDYHRPSDDFHLANIAGMARIAELAAALTSELSTRSARPTLLKNTSVAQIGRVAGPPRAVLGVRLVAGVGNAAEVREVLQGGAAQQAGMQAGDVIVQVADEPCDSVQKLQSSLSKRKPGEAVFIRFLREGLPLEVTVVLQGG